MSSLSSVFYRLIDAALIGIFFIIPSLLICNKVLKSIDFSVQAPLKENCFDVYIVSFDIFWQYKNYCALDDFYKEVHLEHINRKIVQIVMLYYPEHGDVSLSRQLSVLLLLMSDLTPSFNSHHH